MNADAQHVLFVDDEPRVLTSMRALFRRDYHVHLANSGKEALALLKVQPVDVIVTDQRMPGLSGVETLAHVKRLAPNAMRILLTGYADANAIQGSINEGEVFRFLNKPCRPDLLKQTVALAARIARENREPSALEEASSPDPEADTLVNMPIPGQEPGIDVLVLTDDASLVLTVIESSGGGHKVHAAETVKGALEILFKNRVGVLVTDLATDERSVSALTEELKRQIPELVTVVVSDRSDVKSLIDLINYGQIFRFILKPISRGQCRLSIQSAIKKHQRLCDNPWLKRRHVVPKNPRRSRGMITVIGRVMRALRERLSYG
ncbi:MAG: response regulator [Gammaproteobacteria bacterium]